MVNKSLSIPNNALSLVKKYLLQLQNNICDALIDIEKQDKNNCNNATSAINFIEDIWNRDSDLKDTHNKMNQGGGITRVISQGNIFEKAGVNFSHVYGDNLPAAATITRPELTGYKFNALGISVVIHPINPYVPTTHLNVRFFIAEKENSPSIWWFGGGFDLTPYYGFIEDCKHWHKTAALACAPFGENLYARCKKWCDEYFYLPHREEARGIGGLFFDDFNDFGFEHNFSFMQSVGNNFLKAYIPIVLKRKDLIYSEREKNFQLYRRGRYVEFNLIYDRGTLFGLHSKGRTESIFVSLPPNVHWEYNWLPEKNSPEEKLYTEFLPIRDWL